MWKDGDLDKKTNLNRFGGTGCSRSVETSYKEEMERIIEVAIITIGTEAVDLSGMKAKHPEVFVDVLSEVDSEKWG